MAGTVIAVLDHDAILVHRLRRLAERVVGGRLHTAVGIGRRDEVAAGVILIIGGVGVRVHELSELVIRPAVGEAGDVPQRVGHAGHVAVGVIRIHIRTIRRVRRRDQVVVAVVDVEGRIADGIDRLGDQPVLVEEGLGSITGGVGGTDLARCVARVGDRVRPVIERCAGKMALVIVSEILMAHVGELDRRERILGRRVGPRVVGVGGHHVIVRLDADEQLIGRIIRVGGRPPVGVGHLDDPPGGAVSEVHPLARGPGQTGQQPVRISGGDAVAIGVLLVGDGTIGVESRDRTVEFAEREGAVRIRGEDAVVPGLIEVAAAGIGLEFSLEAVRLGNDNRPVGLDRQRVLPPAVEGPAQTEWSHLVPADDRIGVGPRERDRESRRV